MDSRFRHAGLVGKHQALGMREMLEEVARFLQGKGLEVSLEAQTAVNTGIGQLGALSVDELGRNCDLAVVVGGDGTMLGIARRLARYGTALVGINQGRLGFITDVNVGQYEEALAPMIAGHYEEERRTMLEGDVARDGASIFEGFAMNDVVVSRGATASMVELKVDIGDEFVGNFRADGLIIGSPTGSTAYALSAGGPILHPGIAGWVLVPIAPHDLSNRPIVLPDTVEVTIEIVAGRDASVSFDMQSLASLQHGDRVRVRRSPHTVRFLHPPGWSYYATLRRKLHWNAGSPEVLRRLSLRDFVIVDTLEVDFEPGFSVLTGETGAGKSILVDALQLALGSRGDAGVVREGSSRADIGAEFDTPASLAAWLDDAGFERDGDTLLLRRTIDAQGKSRAWINGSAATIAQLREAADHLLDIHGQHAWQSLTRGPAVLALLDGAAGIDAAALAALWSRWKSAAEALAAAGTRQDELDRERERLAWQIGEVDKLAPGDDEWAELEAEHKRLANAQALIDAARTARDAVSESDDSAEANVARALDAIEEVAAFDPALAATIEVLRSAQAQLQDAGHTLGSYLHHAEVDPDRLQALDDRLSAWLGLARRYRRPPAELPALLAEWKAALRRLDAAADTESLQRELDAALADYRREAERIAALRRAAAPKLAAAVTQAMQQLGMAGGRFEVALLPQEAPQSFGLESAEFRVAGHAGSTPRPLAKVASGGELSRIALAIAVTTSASADGGAGTLIFDEIDAGVGGAVAETVGRLMKQLGRERQVLAVTHLPQVAACADHHFVVSKRLRGASTLSTVDAVTGEMRVAEVARMLGGERLSGTSLAHAQEMLEVGGTARSPRKPR